MKDCLQLPVDMLECRNIRILVNNYQRVTENNALFFLSTICGNAMATLFEMLEFTSDSKDWLPEG